MSHAIKRELLQNQIWHGLNFLSKALFLGVLTPFLLLRWGTNRYGMYALASSLVVILAAMDGGIRDATRLALCQADNDNDQLAFRVALQRGVVSFLLIVAAVVFVTAILALLGFFSFWLHLPREGDLLIAVTILLTGLSMATVLMLEPLAARRQLSVLKKVNTFGSVAALPAVALAVALGGGPLSAVLIYFFCQVIPYFWIWRRSGMHREMKWSGVKWEDCLTTYKSSGWLYFNSLVWLVRNHALPFIVSSMTGPAQAGVFYILLRMSEVISTMGAASCETLLASLRGAHTDEDKLTNFRHTYEYCLLFCGFFAIILLCLGQPMVALFFKKQLPVTQWDVTVTAFFGLTSAGSWLLFWSGYGLNVIRPLAICNMTVGILTCLGCYLFQGRYGYTGTLGFASFANVAMIPSLWLITRALGAPPRRVWWEPLRRALPTLILAALLLTSARLSHYLIIEFASLAFVGALVLFDWKRIHR